jgi:hypothetical protein
MYIISWGLTKILQFCLYWVFSYYTPDDSRTTATCSVRIISVNTGCVERNVMWFVLFYAHNVMDHTKFTVCATKLIRLLPSPSHSVYDRRQVTLSGSQHSATSAWSLWSRMPLKFRLDFFMSSSAMFTTWTWQNLWQCVIRQVSAGVAEECTTSIFRLGPPTCQATRCQNPESSLP